MKLTTKEYDAILRTDLTSFTEKVFNTVSPSDTYSPNWHIECIAEHLEACRHGQIKRLIINIPPRFMKSISVSTAFPAWLLGHNPSEKILVASYAQTLSRKHSTDTRHVMRSEWYNSLFPRTDLSPSQEAKDLFETTLMGSRMATSVGGSSTGFGGNFLIVDDPHDPIQALSDVQRQQALTWFDQTWSNRLNDKKNGVMIVIMQRLHTNDLTGHILEKGGWDHLLIPNEAESNITYTFPMSKKEITLKKGDLLHEDRMDLKETNEQKVLLGSYAYAGQYQQVPVPTGGGEFMDDWYSYHNNPSNIKEMNIYILVDPATSKKKTADFTSMIVLGLAPDNNYYILDMVRDRLNPTERIDTLINLHRKWNKLSSKPPAVGYEQYGLTSDIHYLKQEMESQNYRFHIIELRGGMQKEERIRRLIPPMENKRLYFPRSLHYTDCNGIKLDMTKEIINEFSHFPVGIHDDMIDALARIMDEAMNARFPQLTHDIKGYDFSHQEDSGDWMSW